MCVTAERLTPIGNRSHLLATGGFCCEITWHNGASMVFEFALLRVNKYRIKGYHVVFFIFIVEHIGGAPKAIGTRRCFSDF